MNSHYQTHPADAPIIQLVSKILEQAHQNKASDIHWEPIESGLRVRFRIDGVLHEVQQFSKKIRCAIVSHLKIMTGSMNIAEKRLPQDGRMQKFFGEQMIDIRVSCIPTLHGESIVMRLLDRSSFLVGLDELGLCKEDHAILKRLLHLPEGLILVTGPTGAGKTTTLYACLQELNQPDCKIITAEDPVEYQIPGINQVSIHEEIGMTFPVVLRSMLRQAINKIMIGEIRDRETAQIVLNASLTGHLVFSTLHTNDAPSAIARLIDLGIAPFLLASGLRAIVAQRLVRHLCSHCKTPIIFADHELAAFKIEPSQLMQATPKKAHGCSLCHGRGFQGRLALFEILIIDEELRHLIHQHATITELRAHARHGGMRTLREDGLQKILTGKTTPSEVLAVTSNTSY